MTAFSTTPSGAGPWWCPYCDRATVTCYRCSNRDHCGKDLTKDSLEQVIPVSVMPGGGA